MGRSRLFTGVREVWWQRHHLGVPKQRFDFVLREMLPMRIPKRESFLAREPDPPRCPGVKRQSIPGGFAAKSSFLRAFLDECSRKIASGTSSKRCGKWRWMNSGASNSAIFVTDVDVFCGSSPSR
jgi:hypothetical protein